MTNAGNVIEASRDDIRNGLWNHADLLEVTSFTDNKVFHDEVLSLTQARKRGLKVVPLRFLRTRKLKNGEWIHKSRLIAQGFKDPRFADFFTTIDTSISMPAQSVRRLIAVRALS